MRVAMERKKQGKKKPSRRCVMEDLKVPGKRKKRIMRREVMRVKRMMLMM
jgi:hypothetical protein